jgi:hypothetical protein
LAKHRLEKAVDHQVGERVRIAERAGEIVPLPEDVRPYALEHFDLVRIFNL